MKEKNLQPRLLYPVRISFRFNGEIKSLIDKQNLRELSTTQAALQQMLKQLLQQETQERDSQKQTLNKKMAIGTYISIITLNVNGPQHCGLGLLILMFHVKRPGKCYRSPLYVGTHLPPLLHKAMSCVWFQEDIPQHPAQGLPQWVCVG